MSEERRVGKHERRINHPAPAEVAEGAGKFDEVLFDLCRNDDYEGLRAEFHRRGHWVEVGELVDVADGEGTIFCEWTEARYTFPAGTKFYAFREAGKS